MTSRRHFQHFSFDARRDSSPAKGRPFARALLAPILLLLLLPGLVSASPASQLQDNDRIVFVGDSITGQGVNNPEGFVHLIEWACQARPGNTMKFAALGGSGQSVGSWMGVLKDSREKEFNLDVRGVGVKATLDRGADVLVVMLGMNDIIAPYVGEDPQDADAWKERYRTLIRALRQRVHPRVVALGKVTLATEDLSSPKNRVIVELNERAAALA